MLVSKDQITIKVHLFAKDDIQKINSRLQKIFKFYNETALMDVAVYRLMEEFENVDWNNTKSVNTFMENIWNDLEDLKSKKKIKVEMRGLGAIQSD